MRVAVLVALLALVAVADASRINVNGLRALLTDDNDYRDPHKDPHKDPHEDPHKEPMYCKDYKEHEDCPDYYECKPLDKKFCKSEQVCDKDAYGKKSCRYHDVCWEYKCVEVPRYCDPKERYDDDDECKEEYGYGWECKALDKKHCTYKNVCKKFKTDKCKAYDYEDKCHYITGKCKAYDKKKVCKKLKVCVEYKKEQKCDKQKVCKEYKHIQHCKTNHQCAKYDNYGKCTQYGQDCTYTKGPCKEYEYKHVNCRYHPTKECIKYDYKEHDCHYVNTHCKEYEKLRKCVKVHKGCKEYEYGTKCDKVEDKCWYGKCVKKPPPPPPKKKYPSSPYPSTPQTGYQDYRNRG